MTDLENREVFDMWWDSLDHEKYNFNRLQMRMAWNASTQREGFKLVPNLFIADIHDMALDGKYLRETDQTQGKFEEIQEYCKEVMTNVL